MRTPRIELCVQFTNPLIWGREAYILGNPDPTAPTLIAFHGALQSANPRYSVPWRAKFQNDYLSFPRMSGLANDFGPQWKIVFPQSKGWFWNKHKDLDFVLKIAEFHEQAETLAFAGFSAGASPIYWLNHEGRTADGAVIHSAFDPPGRDMPTRPGSTQPVMGLVNKKERIPAWLWPFFPNLSTRKLHREYEELQASYRASFTHGYTDRWGSHYVDSNLHTWWRAGNKHIESWLLSPWE